MFTCIHLYLIYLCLKCSFNIHFSFSYCSGMIMKEVYLRKLTHKNFAKITSVEELSYSIRNVVGETSRELLRKIKRNLMIFTSVTSHLMYNETCLNNQLLPVYTSKSYKSLLCWLPLREVTFMRWFFYWFNQFFLFNIWGDTSRPKYSWKAALVWKVSNGHSFYFNFWK